MREFAGPKHLARSRSQPLIDGGMFVSAVVIQDQMDVQIGLSGLVDTIEKSQKFLMPMPRQTFADNGSFQHI